MKIQFTLFAILLLVFSACKQEVAVTSNENEELNAWFEIKYEEMLQMSPMQLTMEGRKDKYGELDDMSLEAEDKMLEWYEATVNELKTNFDYEALDAESKTSYDLWIYGYEQMKEGRAFQNMDYVFHQMMGIHAQLPGFLINFHKVDSIGDMQAYISRISQTERVMNQLLDRAKKQAAIGILPPRFSFEIVLKQCKDILAGTPFDESETPSAIWKDIQNKIQGLMDAGDIDEVMAEDLQNEAKNTLLNQFRPAYNNLMAWLESEIPNTEVAPTGVSRHTNGQEYYNYRLKLITTTNLTADVIHEIGLQEVERIQNEMVAIKEKVGFEGSLKAFFEFVNTDEQFFYPNTDEGRQAYIDDSKKYLDDLTKKLPDYFGILPKADLEVKRVEAFREQDGAPQHYFPGTPDGSRSGVYYAHLSDMKAMPKTTMEGVAYHEGNPGHHMQISIAQELESVPKFRTQNRIIAYSEGWALYSELLAKEMGGYENPYYDYGRLVNEIWRAIRLVVDTGLHAKGWTEADAIDYFTENSSIAPGAIKAEVQRYMVIPGQATAYKIGMLKIQELRKRAEEELGNQFDIRAFHDVVLGGGALPLELLERRVNDWIAEIK